MLTTAQLELRKTRIGASELFEVLNDPYRLFHAKVTGKSRFTGKEDFIRVGNLLERPTAEDYAHRRAQSGSPVQLLQTMRLEGSMLESMTLLDPKRPWFAGTPDFLPVSARGPALTHVDSLETLWRLRDQGLLDRGLECKTGAAIAEYHLEEDDRWGQGLRPVVLELESFLAGRCDDPAAVAKDLMSRFSLQSHIGAELAEDEEDQWGEAGSSQMPRRYLCQIAGYCALTELPAWDLHRLRFAWGQYQTITYQVKRDLELEGMLLDAGERFVQDHLIPQRPPAQKDLESRRLELARVFPKDNGALRQADRLELVLLENYRDAIIAERRAEVMKDLVEQEIKARIGTDKGLDATQAGLGKVSWGSQAGRTTIDAHAALNGLCARLAEWVPAGELERFRAEALADATKQGEPFRRISRPVAWTKGIEDQIRAELTEKTPAE